MKFVDYTFTAQNPLFTGSNADSGIIKTLRREKVLLETPIEFKSIFKSKLDRTKSVMNIIYPIYTEIDQNLKRKNYGFYDAYSNKVKAATYVSNKEEFLTKLIDSCGINSISNESSILIKESIQKFNTIELLETIKSEHAYLMILLRIYVTEFKNKNKVAKQGLSEPSIVDEIFKNEVDSEKISNFIKCFENVPYFHGNSIRGYLRRLLLSDLEQICGITKLEKSIYHQLHTGGNISDSTGFEDIEKREEFIRNCPPIALFGSAIGNMTIKGELSVLGARLQCLENKTGNLSFWNYIQVVFGTRLDSSKTEQAIKIIDNGEKRNPDQMLYEYETFCKGSKFDSSFILLTNKDHKNYDLIESTFYRMITLWKQNHIIGGNSARDCGLIDINIDIPKNADKLYLDYLEQNKKTIKKYFEYDI